MSSKNQPTSSSAEQPTEKPGVLSSHETGSNTLPLGVYMLGNKPSPNSAPERLAITRKLCIQNAKICSDWGQKTKADTWTLLAQTVEAVGEIGLR